MRKSIIDAEMAERKNLTFKERNDFVEAGAGAGKTYSLITRIFYQLVKKPNRCEPKDIVAITFTNKAAEELRVRIVKRLQEIEKDPEEEKLYKERKQQLLQTIDEMQISTIHKFCDNILRENAIQAGLSPDYQIIMEEDEERRIRKTISNFFKNFNHADWAKYEELDNYKNVKENICDCFRGLITNVDHLRKDQIYTYHGLGKTRAQLINDNKTAKEAYFSSLYDFFMNNEEEIMRNTEEALFKKETEGGKYTGYVSSAFIDVFKNFDKYNDEEEFALAIEDAGKGLALNRTQLKKTDEGKEVVNHFDEWKKAELELDIYFTLLFIDDAYNLYAQYLNDCDNDISHLSNNDLIYRTCKLLQDKPNVTSRLRKKIKHLYIDEYQDTDSVQYKIAHLISKGREDCLYLVGDPKQSIYRFRGAEPDVFFTTKNDYRSHPDTHDIYTLNINFRSNNKILEWVNEKYSNTGKNIPLVSDPTYVYPEMLYADKNYIDESTKEDNDLVGFYFYPHSDADKVANLINYLKDNYLVRRTYKKINDEGEEVDTYKFEKIKYKDIMLLFEGHKKMPPYIASLNKANIPSQIFGSSDFSETFALRTFVNLFDVLNSNSNSNLAIAESVFQTIYPSKYIDKTVEESQEITSNIINDLRKKTHKMTSYGRAIFLIEHMNLLLSEGDIVYSFELNNMKSKLYQMVEEVFAQGFINGSEIVECFREYLDTAVERESSIEKNGDAVMVINLHKAKGLEAPIVIWVCTQKSNNSQKSSTFKDNKYYYSGLITKLDKLGTVSDIITIKNEEELEKRRLEYVAATRPGEAFIFCKGPDYKAGLFNNKDFNYEIELLPSIDIEESSNEDNEKPVPHDYHSLEHIFNNESKNQIKVTSPSSLENGSSKTRDKLRSEAGEIVESDRPRSNDVGTILHRALELFVKYGFTADKATDLALTEHSDLAEGEERMRDFIFTAVKAYIEYFHKNGLDQYDAEPEFTFSYHLDNQINNGSIDLLLIKGDDCIIIDYKSDEAEYILDDGVFEITLKEKYEPQLNSYEEVVKHLFPEIKSIKKQIIYFRRYDRNNKQIDVLSYEL